MENCEDSVSGGYGMENIPLKTGDAMGRMSLWVWSSFPPDVRRMTSASGGACHSAPMMKLKIGR